MSAESTSSIEPHIAHTVTKLAGAEGRVVVCGSHGGRYAGLAACAAGVKAILLNDAGRGLDDAGTEGIAICADNGMAAATLDHDSCRIGNAEDGYARGIVSKANRLAAALGVAPGTTAKEAAKLLADAPKPTNRPELGTEHRSVRTLGERRLVVIDSVSLVKEDEDEGALVVTGSHGGLVGGDPASAGRANAFLFAFNDAGIGIDDAAITRLPILAERGTAAVTVDCFTARIGIGQSTYEDGIISRVNSVASALGMVEGTPLKAALAALCDSQAR